MRAEAEGCATAAFARTWTRLTEATSQYYFNTCRWNKPALKRSRNQNKFQKDTVTSGNTVNTLRSGYPSNILCKTQDSQDIQ